MYRRLKYRAVWIAVLCIVGCSAAEAEIPRPVGFWRFEENTNDSGSAHNNGALKGTAALGADPQLGNCLELDGEGYMAIPSGVTELGDADFTIAAWIKTAEIGVSILSKSNGDTEWEEAEKEVYVADSDSSEADNDGTVEMVGHSAAWIRGNARVDDGRWHHIAVTWDREGEDGCVYVDAVESADDVSFGGLADNPDDAVRIGFSESAHSGGNFVGRIADVAIFDAVLTGEQVAELMQLQKAAGTTMAIPVRADEDRPVTLDTDPNLAGWWKFNEESGETAADSSGHGRKGTLKDGLSFDEDSTAGRTGKALKFGGDDECVQIDNYKGVTGTRPRTVAVWIKTSRPRGQIITWGADDYGQMWIFGFIRGRVGVTPNGGYLYMNRETHDDEWHHVAAVVREAELPNLHDDVKLYLDGGPAAIHDIGLLDLWPLETGDELDVRIGTNFQGLIDDARIYERALSEDEVTALFRLRSNRPLRRSKR
jgi:hypothetical protein